MDLPKGDVTINLPESFFDSVRAGCSSSIDFDGHSGIMLCRTTGLLAPDDRFYEPVEGLGDIYEAANRLDKRIKEAIAASRREGGGSS